MGTDAGDGFTANYWKLSAGRRLRRDLILTPLAVAGLIALGQATGWDAGPAVALVLGVFAVTTWLNLRAYRAEKRVAERLADGVSTAWRPLAVVVDGRPLPTQWPGAWGQSHLLVTGDRYEMWVSGRVFEAGTSVTVADGDIRAADVVPDRGPSRPQISRVDGDVLTACAAAPGADRPTAFSSRRGSGHTLSVWLRVR